MVAHYMVHWAGLNMVTKREVIYESARVASYLAGEGTAVGKLNYIIPTLTFSGDNRLLICRNGLCGLLGIGRLAWKTAVNEPNKIYAQKGLSGGMSSRGKGYIEINQSMTEFFLDLSEEGTPFATRIVCEATGMTLRDDNIDEVVLPPHITKRQCYARWCYERGWIIDKKNTATSVMKLVLEFKERPYDEDDEDGIALFLVGSERRKVCTWATFLNFWNQRFGYIKIRKKGADTCTDCLILTNEFRMRLKRAPVVEHNNEDDSSD